jgi:hypothetical protein
MVSTANCAVSARNGQAMISAALFHGDGSVCASPWSCAQDDHTYVPPQCRAREAGQSGGCELPAGHPGGHLYGS